MEIKMRTCEKCRVSVSGSPDEFGKCPLCQNPLAGTDPAGSDVFPFIPLLGHKHGLMFRMLQLCSAVAVIVSAAVNWMFPQGGFWSLFVAAGVACVWLIIIISIRKRNNILKNLAYQVTAASILSVLWDVFTGWHGWSVDYVIPIAFITAMAATTVLARVLKMRAETYLIYSLLLILYGIIPAVFVLSGLCAIVYPAMICVTCSLVSFAALMIFEGKNMIGELHRRLHM